MNNTLKRVNHIMVDSENLCWRV